MVGLLLDSGESLFSSIKAPMSCCLFWFNLTRKASKSSSSSYWMANYFFLSRSFSMASLFSSPLLSSIGLASRPAPYPSVLNLSSSLYGIAASCFKFEFAFSGVALFSNTEKLPAFFPSQTTLFEVSIEPLGSKGSVILSVSNSFLGLWSICSDTWMASAAILSNSRFWILRQALWILIAAWFWILSF